MIAHRDDLHIRSQVRGPIRTDRCPPDGEAAARRYLRDHPPREGTPAWLWALVAGLCLLGAVLA